MSDKKHENADVDAIIIENIESSRIPVREIEMKQQAERPNDRPNDRPGDRPGDRPTDRPTERPSDKPAENRMMQFFNQEFLDKKIDFKPK